MERITAKRKTGQVTLELASALICILLLLLGSLKIFLWVNERLVLRHKDYVDGRVKAGSSNIEVQVNESDTTRYKPLNIFK